MTKPPFGSSYVMGFAPFLMDTVIGRSYATFSKVEILPNGTVQRGPRDSSRLKWRKMSDECGGSGQTPNTIRAVGRRVTQHVEADAQAGPVVPWGEPDAEHALLVVPWHCNW